MRGLVAAARCGAGAPLSGRTTGDVFITPISCVPRISFDTCPEAILDGRRPAALISFGRSSEDQCPPAPARSVGRSPARDAARRVRPGAVASAGGERSLTGTLEVSTADDFVTAPVHSYWLRTANGRVALNFPHHPPAAGGTRVRVTGQAAASGATTVTSMEVLGPPPRPPQPSPTRTSRFCS